MDRFERDVLEARGSSTLLLPETLPPRLVDAWVSRDEGATSVSFYSENAPVVTVCTGAQATCASLSADAPLLEVEVEQQTAVVSLGRREAPGAEPMLGPQLEAFWEDVTFTSGLPEWLSQG